MPNRRNLSRLAIASLLAAAISAPAASAMPADPVTTTDPATAPAYPTPTAKSEQSAAQQDMHASTVQQARADGPGSPRRAREGPGDRAPDQGAGRSWTRSRSPARPCSRPPRTAVPAAADRHDDRRRRRRHRVADRCDLARGRAAHRWRPGRRGVPYARLGPSCSLAGTEAGAPLERGAPVSRGSVSAEEDLGRLEQLGVEQLGLGQRLGQRDADDLGPAQRDHLAEVALAAPRRSPRRRSASRARGRRRSGVPPRCTWPRIVMRDSNPVRSSISRSSWIAMPPSRTCPNASLVSNSDSSSPSLGVAPSATTTIEKLRPCAWRRRRRSQTSSMSNGRSGTSTTSAPPAMPE